MYHDTADFIMLLENTDLGIKSKNKIIHFRPTTWKKVPYNPFFSSSISSFLVGEVHLLRLQLF